MQNNPVFDALCIRCKKRFNYVVVCKKPGEFIRWVERTDRLSAKCPTCKRHSVILFGEKR